MKAICCCIALVVLALVGCDDHKAPSPPAASADKPVPKDEPPSKTDSSTRDALEPEEDDKPGTPLAKLSAAQTKKIVDGLNDVCPDTLCEGDFDWKFKSLEHAHGRITLTFTATHQQSKKTFDDKITFAFSGDVLDSDGVDTEAWSDALNKAILEWENKHRG